MKVFEFEQYSLDWWAARRGIPTASEFDKILTPATMKLSKQADPYIYQLVGEKLSTNYPPVGMIETPEMTHGRITEAEARAWYEFDRSTEVQQVGFCLSDCGNYGCSPDGLTEDGGIEIKCPLPKTHIDWLLGGQLPTEHKAQIHGSLLVTGRSHWDFVSYCQGLPTLVIRTVPDEYTEALRVAMVGFMARYREIEERIVSMF